MGKTPNMVYNTLISEAVANRKTLSQKPKEKLCSIETAILEAWDKYGMESLDRITVLREFYKEGYPAPKGQKHIQDWYDLGMAWTKNIPNCRDNMLIVFEGKI